MVVKHVRSGGGFRLGSLVVQHINNPETLNPLRSMWVTLEPRPTKDGPRPTKEKGHQRPRPTPS
jgi:hypothetical protein